MSAPVSEVPTVCASVGKKRRGLRTSPDVSYVMAMGMGGRHDVIDLIRSAGTVRRAELEALGVSPSSPYRLVSEGRVVRLDRGLYAVAEHEPSASRGVDRAARDGPTSTARVPADARGTVLRGALTEGVETHRIEGVDVRVYSPAKTVADCFEYRNTVGIDVAVEALRDSGVSHRGRATELAGYARICRVTRAMQPYLDAIP